MRRFICLIAAAVGLVTSGHAQEGAQDPGTFVFKSAVEQVAVAAIVRDGRGKLVTDLAPSDFELFDAGQRRTITNVWSEPSPASVAILLDASGSMATKMERAKNIASTLVWGLKTGDEVAYFSFDTSLQLLSPFSTDFKDQAPLHTTKAFGATSLWDAIAETSQRISDRQRRRALVVITDGVDSASRLTPAEVSGIASALDVPVYVLVISFMSEEGGRDPAVLLGPLADLAAWTGGNSIVVREEGAIMPATRQVLAELHHQYVIAFEPSTTPGWHPLVLRTRKPGFFVRARSGYVVK